MVLPGHPTPRGLLPGSPRPSGGAQHRKDRFLSPLVVPEVAQLSHPYTSITRGRALPPRGSGIASQSRAQLPLAPYAPRAGSARRSCACCGGAAPDPRAAGAAQRASAPVPPAAPVPGGLGRMGRRRADGRPASRGAGGVEGDQVPHVGVDVGDGLVVVVGVVGAPASPGYRGGCTSPPGRPTAGAARPPFLVLRSALPPPPLCPVLPAPGGPRHPSPPCPWASSLPPAPGSDALPPPCPLACVACPYLCHPRPFVFRWRLRPSRALASVLCRALPLAPASFACPCPCPALCPVSLRQLPAPWPAPCACPPPLLLALVPYPCPCPLSSLRALWPVPCVRPLGLPLSPSAPRPAFPWPAPWPTRSRSRPSWTTRRASRCCGSCGSVTPGGVRLGARGRTGRGLPSEKVALGAYGFGGLVWVLLGLVCARYLAPSLFSDAGAAVAGGALGARVGPVPRAGGVPGAAARPAGAAVAAPCASAPPPGGWAAAAAA